MPSVTLPTPVLFEILRPQLVAKRQHLKISLPYLAQDLQVSSYQLAQWEAGNSFDISDETLRRWAALLDLTLYPYHTRSLEVALMNFGIHADDIAVVLTNLQRVRHLTRVTVKPPLTYDEYLNKQTGNPIDKA